MGPLVPDIISNNLNFIVALVIGILFGMILEQAGFSTSKKLVGLFYGYDFTVLRVFFTAGIVAMIGVMGLEHFGLLDINLVYINPTFLWSAIVGGAVMGIGFVIGGFCPGTSVCAAAIGKIDAMIFIGGAFLGVLVFAEGYPLFETLYKSANWGSPTFYETLSVSKNLFAFIMVVFALTGFFIASIVENRVNGIKKPPIRLTPYYVGIAAIGILLAVSAFIFPDRKTTLIQMTEKTEVLDEYPIEVMAIDQFAMCVMRMDECNKFQIFDFRTAEDFAKFSFPRSYLFTFDNLFEKEPTKLLTIKSRINVFIADDELTAKKMAIVASELGYKRIKILQNGFSGFKEMVLNFEPIEPATTIDEKNTNRFRLKAKKVIPILADQFKSKTGPVQKKQKRVIGGC
ncbi:MAG: YeeE/YedE family protein [Ignavibacteriales bacterium]|nr:YeeE/YedE family protein [Ignavibacteriales bacterium]MCF8306189.1 YeeE/YedE family protein [Ignavibacteriales bacterium]MCF8315910.1 YeeE/YedE family protein [Ignavibacteriales bacterium]MCF8437504.1 YeeE/YedE family protein [Ignavibacteriales bacterium]